MMALQENNGLKELWEKTKESDWIIAREHDWRVDSVIGKECIEKRLSNTEYVKEQINNDIKSFIMEEFMQWKYTDWGLCAQWSIDAILDLLLSPK